MDAVHALKPDPTNIVTGTPGSGKDVVHEKTYDASKSRRFFDFEYRDAVTVVQDTYLNFVERGWM